MKNTRRRTLVRFRPNIKDLGQRWDDEEFAQEFVEPISASLQEERTPARSSDAGYCPPPPEQE